MQYPIGALKPCLAASVAFVIAMCAGAIQSHAAAIGDECRPIDMPSSVRKLESEHPADEADVLSVLEIGGMIGQGLSVSPDGKYAAFEAHSVDLSHDTYKVSWIIAPVEGGGTAINASCAGDPTLFRHGNISGFVDGAWISEPPKWAPDGKSIYVRRKGEDGIQIWRIPMSGGTTEVTHLSQNVLSFEILPDGRSIRASVGSSRGALKENAVRENSAGRYYDDTIDWDALHARNFESEELLPGKAPETLILDANTGVPMPHMDGSPPSSDILQSKITGHPNAEQITRYPKSNLMAWVDGEFQSQVSAIAAPGRLMALVNGTETACADSNVCSGHISIIPVTVDSGVGEVFFTRSDSQNPGVMDIWSWAPARAQLRHVGTYDDVFLTDCRAVRLDLVCFEETPSYPRTLVRIDLQGGNITPLFDPNPQWKNLILGKVEKRVWRATRGNRPDWGYLVKPVGYVSGHRYPLVIVDYRAKRVSKAGSADETPIQALAAKGFMVLAYDFLDADDIQEKALSLNGQASTDYLLKRLFALPDLPEIRAPFETLEVVLDQLDREGLIDPKRVGMTGFSTGIAPLAFGLIHSHRISTAIFSNNGWNPATYYAEVKHARDITRPVGLGPEGGDDNVWREVSLGLNAHKVTTSILFNIGQEEYGNEISDLEELKDAGVAAELYVYDDEHHVKWYPSHRNSIYRRNIQWFEYWLEGVRNANPVDPEQYARWAHLCDLQIRRVGKSNVSCIASSQ